MSSPALNLKPNDVEASEKRGKYTFCVVGCGKVGILHACLFAEAGFKVICADADQAIVNKIALGKTPFLIREIDPRLKSYVKKKLITATSDVKTAVSQSDIIAITVPVEIDKKKKADYSKIKNTCKLVGSSLRSGTLVVITATVGVGVTEDLIKESLENASGFKVGTDLGLAYSPIQESAAQSLETLSNRERIVAASDRDSLNATATVLKTVTKSGVKKIENVKLAEAATLFDATQQSVNSALANELALFCEKVGIDYLETHEIAKSSGLSSLFLPTLDDENDFAETHLLMENAENLNLKLRFPLISMEVNEDTLKRAVNLTKDALRNCGKPLRRARISLLGITETPNVKSEPKRVVAKLAKMLEARGAKVNLYDPYFSRDELAELLDYKHATSIAEALEGADCVLIVTGHEQFRRLNWKKMKVMMKNPAAIVDLGGAVEPEKIEREGFIYRGLGRGVWTK
jgi:nucleotide sugar dehydrogenase